MTNIEYIKILQNIISKLIFLRIIIPKFMMRRQPFHVKMSKINKFKWTYGLFGHNYRVAALSTLYLNVLGIIIPSLKSIKQF